LNERNNTITLTSANTIVYIYLQSHLGGEIKEQHIVS